MNTTDTLTPATLAARWGCTTGHLANCRSAGTGPAYMRPAGRVVYALAEIERYEAARTVEPVTAA